MISSIEGTLTDMGDGYAQLRAGPFTYQVFIPSRLARKLSMKLGEEVKLFTVHYLEGGTRFGNPVPRLIGFENELEREFFERFITVPDVGARRALKALTLPIKEIAEAIEMEDLAALRGLKGIGEKTAKKIIAQLKGQMGKYALLSQSEPLESPIAGEATEIKELGIKALTHLGYRPAEAERMVAQAMSRGRFTSVEELIREVYRCQKEKSLNGARAASHP